MNDKVIFTIVAKNYLHYAFTLGDSVKLNSPESDFRIYVADGLNDNICKIAADKGLKVFDVLKMGAGDDFLKMAFYYEVTEYCTSVKPFVISSLFTQGYDFVTYLDPDIFVYRSLEGSIYSYLKNNNIVLTPHICSPISDDNTPNDIDHLFSGTYNLGFISLKKNEASLSMVDWWSNKCLNQCFNDPIKGLFVDQKWINLVPGMFEGVFVSRNLGLNMAYWNLHERYITDRLFVNNTDELIFFHFSGINIKKIGSISKYQDRFSLSDRKDIKDLFVDYAENVEKNAFDDFKCDYPFNKYFDGKDISLLSRRVYYWNRESLKTPFESLEAESAFKIVLKNYGITDGKFNTTKPSKQKINKNAKVINYFMRLILLLIGPYRYVQLIKYFGILSSLNNNRFLEKKIDGHKD